MRFRTALVAAVLTAAVGFTSAVAADDVEIKVRDLDKDRSVHSDAERWTPGEWTERQAVTERRTATVREGREYGRVTERPMESGVLAGRQFSGPYRYFFTDREGKYNYYLDRYGYPYAYGGTEQALPTTVLGYVPPEQAGGGPVRYYRQERPLSRSAFDRGPRGIE